MSMIEAGKTCSSIAYCDTEKRQSKDTFVLSFEYIGQFVRLLMRPLGASYMPSRG